MKARSSNFWIGVLNKTTKDTLDYKKNKLEEMKQGLSLEALMLKLKLEYFGHIIRRYESLEETFNAWKTRESSTKDKIGRQHYWNDRKEHTRTQGDGHRQRSMMHKCPLDHEESESTEQQQCCGSSLSNQTR